MEHGRQPTATSWSTDDIPDQHGRVAVVTGGNGGLGRVSAGALARAGAHVVLACRDTAKGERARADIRADAPGTSIEVRALDLADLASVRSFANAWAGARLDLLINNAGIALVPFARTADGFESQLGTNHLGHFALTGLLLPGLLAAPAPRVVTVSSESQRWGRIRLADLQRERRYHRLAAYIQSKRANVCFALELQRLADAAGVALRSMAVVPGFSETGVLVDGPHRRGGALWNVAVRWANRFAQPATDGARTSLYAATRPDLPGGTYVAPAGPLELRGTPTVRDPRVAGRDRATAERLWAVSAELTGVDYAALSTGA